MMKRFLAMLLAALLLLGATALADADADDADFGFEFDEDSYDGEWVSIDELGFEFCLPDGWKPVEATNGTTYAAKSADGSASFAIRLEAEGVEDLERWGKAHLKAYKVQEASFYDALVVEEERSVVVRLALSDGKLIAFEFDRESPEALPGVFALSIVGSVCELWDDIEVPFGEDEEGDFDFGEAFESDLD